MSLKTAKALCTNCKRLDAIAPYKWCLKCRIKRRRYCKENAALVAAVQKRAYEKNNYKERSRVQKIKQRHELRANVLEKLGNKCVHCGFNDRRALQVDHVKGGGQREWLRAANYTAYYRKILADTTGRYQLLCANCNWIKRYENYEI